MNDAIVQEMARKGWQAGNTQVAFQACDDSLASTGEWDESLCRSNARKYVANSDVIGVIGTYNSGCAQIEIPILNRAPGGGVPMVSPGNTLVCLTEPGSICKPDEPGVYYPSGRRNYVRVVPNDAVQGAGLASFANESGIRRPFVLYAADDPTSRGQALAFVGAAEKLGMLPRGSAQWDPKASSYAIQMRKVRASGADAYRSRGLVGAERGTVDQGQGGRVRPQRRRRQAACLRRLRAAGDHRPGRPRLGRDVRQPAGQGAGQPPRGRLRPSSRRSRPRPRASRSRSSLPMPARPQRC